MAVGWSPKIKLCNCEQVSALHGFSSQAIDSTLTNQNYVNLKKDQDHRLSENPHRFNLLLSLFLLLSDPITLFHGSEIFYGLLNVMKILNRISLLKRHGEIWQEPVYKSFACPLCENFYKKWYYESSCKEGSEVIHNTTFSMLILSQIVAHIMCNKEVFSLAVNCKYFFILEFICALWKLECSDISIMMWLDCMWALSYSLSATVSSQIAHLNPWFIQHVQIHGIFWVDAITKNFASMLPFAALNVMWFSRSSLFTILLPHIVHALYGSIRLWFS